MVMKNLFSKKLINLLPQNTKKYHRFLTLANLRTGADIGVSGFTTLIGLSFLFWRWRFASIFS
jgi:hypothetical protein